MNNAGHEIVKSEIRMPDGPIKNTGDHLDDVNSPPRS